jgi:hypothetical protein
MITGSVLQLQEITTYVLVPTVHQSAKQLFFSVGTVKRGNIEQVINFKVKLKILGDVL